MLIFFLPTGVWAYPFDYVGSWVTRPIPMKEDEFKKAKYDLARTMEILLQKGKQIIEDKKNSEKDSGNLQGRPLKRWRLKRQLMKD